MLPEPVCHPGEVLRHPPHVAVEPAATRVGAEAQVLLDELGEGAAALRDVRDAEVRNRLGAATAERLPSR